MKQAFTVTEKRRLFLPPDPPSGIPCDYVAWNGSPCLMDKHDDGFHCVVLDNSKHVRITVAESTKVRKPRKGQVGAAAVL